VGPRAQHHRGRELPALGDAALAEDVTQETFLRLYQRLPTFAGRSRFSTWVFRVARNAGVDALRAARRHDRLLAALPPPPPGPAPEARVEAMAAVAPSTPSRPRSPSRIRRAGRGRSWNRSTSPASSSAASRKLTVSIDVAIAFQSVATCSMSPRARIWTIVAALCAVAVAATVGSGS
jgi:RNA polymerase sigma factor (sigma-70 family)